MKTILVDLNLCLGCKTCEMACATERVSKSKNLLEAILEIPRPIPRISVQSNGQVSIPIQCRQCEEAPCLDVCPSGAIHREGKEGKIVLNENMCIGCWMCVMVCPFGAINSYLEIKKADKCDQCIYMDYPVCVDACPTGALKLVETDEKMSEIIIKRKKEGIFEYIERGAKENV